MKNKDIVNLLLQYHPTLPDYQGCDEYKCGNEEDECTGVAVALVPTVEVIQEAHKQNCNLLITHEPLYYQTPDFPEWKGCFDNQVQKDKQKMIEDYGITIWRDHDHMHAHQPDSIFTGVIHYLGWDKYKRFDLNGGIPTFMPFIIPETTVEQLAKHMKDTIDMNGLRYIGNPTDKVTRIAIAGHFYPNSFEADGFREDGYYHDYALTIMELMEKHDIQVLIPGEIIEWTILSYIRDAIQQGKIRACLNAGHFNWEELGMKYLTETIKELVIEKIPVTYIPSKDPYHFI